MRRAAFSLTVAAVTVTLGCGENSSLPSGAQGGKAGMPASPLLTAGSGGSSGSAGGTSAGGRPDTGVAGAGTSNAGNGAAGSGSAGRGGSAGAAGTSATAGSTNAAGAPGAGAGGAAGTGNGGAGELGASGAGGETGGPLAVLVFSRTQGFPHESIPQGLTALTQLAVQRGFALAATEDPSVFSEEKLAKVSVVVFLSTTGDVLDDAQEAAFESFIRRGGGFVGIHSASDTEYDWAFYGALVGAYFREHPATVQQATVHVEDPSDPIMTGIPSDWQRTDEWYAFKENPRQNVHVLMTVDEASYAPGASSMGGDHPITWCHEYEGGRAFYTALGHTDESYSDPLFTGLLGRAIEWAAGRL